MTSIDSNQEELDKVRAEKDRQMQGVLDAKEKANQGMDRIHELRAKQAFRRMTDLPCTGGAC